MASSNVKIMSGSSDLGCHCVLTNKNNRFVLIFQIELLTIVISRIFIFFELFCILGPDGLTYYLLFVIDDDVKNIVVVQVEGEVVVCDVYTGKKIAGAQRCAKSRFLYMIYLSQSQIEELESKHAAEVNKLQKQTDALDNQIIRLRMAAANR